MRKLALSTLLAVVLFITLQKAGIECTQSGFPVFGSCLVLSSHILKVMFLILLVLLLSKALQQSNTVLRILLGILCLPLLLVSCSLTLISGRIILNMSRPAIPGSFIKDQSAVDQLSRLANEMIGIKKVFWVGNGRDRFVFGIEYEDGDYQFDSRFVPDNYDFSKPLGAEDMSQAHHDDLPFQSGSLQFTDKKILDPKDYDFCKRASGIIRKIGFDNIKLYRNKDVVQYQIHDFIGWDNGSYYIYYFCPRDTLPDEFTYSKKLNSNWYYISKPRFER
jgi:hypothetical protein